MRVDEGREGWGLLALRMKARAVVGMGGTKMLSGPGSELRLGSREGEGERKRAKLIGGGRTRDVPGGAHQQSDWSLSCDHGLDYAS